VSTGLIALLDDVAGLAKVAAASLDDAAAQATRASVKAAGVVIDDAAVTPRYVIGFAAERELPIIGRIALGSLKNKVLYLLPAALVLSFLAPWLIQPLLMIGGAYLCYEGTEKVVEAFWPHHAGHLEADPTAAGAPDLVRLEDEKIASAIRTDFILSAEIMAITLSTVANASFGMQAMVLGVVGIGITALVYGAVALIVKADDAGVALAQNGRPASSLLGLRSMPAHSAPGGADRALRPLTQNLGRGIVLGMPVLLKVLSVVGTAAMVWVGGGIIVHGLEVYGFGALAHAIHDVARGAGHALPAAAGFIEWLVSAAAAGILGLLVGAAIIIAIRSVVKLRT
jgi:predicted DNA repair protein MutK